MKPADFLKVIPVIAILIGVVALLVYMERHPEKIKADPTRGDMALINSRLKTLEEKVSALEAKAR